MEDRPILSDGPAAARTRWWRRLLRHRWAMWTLWAMGIAVLVSPPLGLLDPGALALALDPELLALMIGTALLMVRGNVRALTTDLLIGLRGVRSRLTGQRF